MGRPTKSRCICSLPKVRKVCPHGLRSEEEIQLTYDEYEVLRLLDYQQLTQEECSRKMDISRPTVTRIYNEARRKMAEMLVTGKSIVIGGGDVSVCERMKPECVHEVNCCHRNKNAGAVEMINLLT